MPKTYQEIVEHADELADAFEAYEPSQESLDRPLSPEQVLRLAVIRRAAAEQEVEQAVAQAREAHVTWATVGRILGTSTQAANRRYRTATVTTGSPRKGGEVTFAVGSQGKAEKRFGTEKKSNPTKKASPKGRSNKSA